MECTNLFLLMISAVETVILVIVGRYEMKKGDPKNDPGNIEMRSAIKSV